MMPPGTRECPECGYVHVRKPKVVTIDGQLIRYDGHRKTEVIGYTEDFKRRWYAELMGYVEINNHLPGSAYRKYIAKFGEKPAWPKIRAIYPSPEVSRWAKSRDIAWWKSQQRRKEA